MSKLRTLFVVTIAVILFDEVVNSSHVHSHAKPAANNAAPALDWEQAVQHTQEWMAFCIGRKHHILSEDCKKAGKSNEVSAVIKAVESWMGSDAGKGVKQKYTSECSEPHPDESTVKRCAEHIEDAIKQCSKL